MDSHLPRSLASAEIKIFQVDGYKKENLNFSAKVIAPPLGGHGLLPRSAFSLFFFHLENFRILFFFSFFVVVSIAVLFFLDSFHWRG